MKIKTSALTASILFEHCKNSESLAKQMNKIPSKAQVVFLDVSKTELLTALRNLREFMDLNQNTENVIYTSTLREIEYFAAKA
jgi:hypothetical protein